MHSQNTLKNSRFDLIPYPKISHSFHHLIQWFNQHKRWLKFRESSSSDNQAYWVWISEIMLQQTTVQTVIPYFERFINAFPSIQDLASSPLEKVLHLWSGLGYYSRARNLHKTAQIIINEYDGVFPNLYQDIIKLPGIGPYTAGAILSFAYNQPFPILEANTIRVLSRLRGIENISPSKKREWKLAHLLIQFAHFLSIEARLFNTAFMELGALVCKIQNPLCQSCPFQSICKVFQKKWNPSLFPKPTVKKDKIIIHEWSPLYINSKKQIFLVKDPTKKWLKDLWDLPILPLEKQNSLTTDFVIHYTITQHKIDRYISIIYHEEPSINTDKLEAQWVCIENILNLNQLPMSSALKKVLQQLTSRKSLSLF